MNDIVECFQTIKTEGKFENLNIAYKLSNSNGKPLEDTELSMLKTLDKGHGRIEKRSYYYTQNISWMIDAKKEWYGLKGVGMVERETEKAGKKSKETSNYIGSITSLSLHCGTYPNWTVWF